jgi:hypothetical protein
MTYLEGLIEAPETPLLLQEHFGISASCWRASNGNESQPNPRNFQQSHGRNKLPAPVFVLSLPKSGTTTTQKYFNCGQQKTASHYVATLNNGKLVTHGACLERNIKRNRPMLEGCGDFLAWTDMGSYYKEKVNGTTTHQCFFPSVHGLEQIAKDYPRASILLVVRESRAWYQSAKDWSQGSLLKRMGKFCSGFPDDASGNDARAWMDFYEAHTKSIRRFAREHPSLTYVEVSLESPDTAHILEERVGISATCWGDCKPNLRVKNRCRFASLNETWEDGR